MRKCSCKNCYVKKYAKQIHNKDIVNNKYINNNSRIRYINNLTRIRYINNNSRKNIKKHKTTKYGKPHLNNFVSNNNNGAVSKMDFAKNRAAARRHQENRKKNNNNSKKNYKLSESTMKSWNTIHIKARNANTEEKKDEFVEYMNFLTKNFPCPNCIDHIRQYLAKHPIEKYYDIKDKNGNDIGLFKWSWEFHNEVNKRLNKKIMTWEELLRIYI